MIIKWLFDRVMSLVGLVCLMPVLVVIGVLIKWRMPGPVFFVQERIGRFGRRFKCHKFRTMTVNHGGSSVSVAGESRITPLGATLRRYKLDELPELWDVLRGEMSFVGPRPDVPGYADMLEGEDRLILELRPGITGPATLKYRNEEEMIRDYVQRNSGMNGLSDEELAVWFNDNVIYPDKVRINLEYYRNWSFFSDLKLIFETVF